MTSLLDIRNRIKSVQNVGQITKAMEMVAAAQLKKAQVYYQHSQRYYGEWKKILNQFAPQIPREYRKAFWKNTAEKSLVLIVSSNRGLCGNYNSSLFRAAEKLLFSYQKEQVELILIGKKAVTHFAHRKYSIRESIIPPKGMLGHDEIVNLSAGLLKDYLSGAYNQVVVIYMHSHSLVSREGISEILLPIPQEDKPQKNINYLMEPEPGDLSLEFIPHYLQSQLFMIFRDAFAGELSARSFAMKKATNNARDMVESLILKRNKIRQANITREMIEITSGAIGDRA